MKIESKKTRQLIVNFFCLFRKLYSPVLFWILWHTKIKRSITKLEKEELKGLYGVMFDLGYRNFVDYMQEIIEWLPERGKGLLDFTYGYKWLNLSEKVVKAWGRDCDDISAIWYDYLKDKGWEGVYTIMCMSKEINTAHIFTVARRSIGEPFQVYDNTKGPYSYNETHVVKAVESHIKYRETVNEERYEGTVWSFYRIFRNILK